MKWKPLMAVVLGGLVFGPGRGPADEIELPKYVGREVCLQCHTADQAAGACLVEPNAKHARAYQALTRPEAEDIALLCGIATPPTESRICLGCHAAAADVGPRWTEGSFNIRLGVQCEACHDAGSQHAAARRSGRKEPRALEEPSIRRRSREYCATCHVPLPSHRAVLDEGFRRTAADRLYKTPVNLVTSPDGALLYITCEHSDSLLVVDAAARRVVDEIAAGRSPHDVAVSPDGRWLYVTNRMSDTLSVIDAAARKVVTELSVGDEPHGVHADASGKWIFVLNTLEDSVSVIDAKKLTEEKRLTTSPGPWSLALHADGKSLYLTSVRPSPLRFRDPPRSEMPVVDLGRAVVTHRLIVPEANMLQGVAGVPGRNVILFTLMRTKNLIPTTRLAQGWTITNGLGVAWPDGRVDQVLLDAPADYFPDPMDVAVSPDGRHALVTSGGSDRVAVVDVGALLATLAAASEHERVEVLPNHLGMSSRFVAKHIAVGSNPRGVAFSPDGRFAYVVNALDDSVTVIDADGFTTIAEIALGGPAEISEIRRGERLFHSANITFGRQFSCRSCHPDGHTNGLTIDIEADGVGMHPVDNRSLRGILDTGPFKWEGVNPSLHRQCGARLAVFFTRLAPYPPEELAALVRYECTIELPPNRYRSPEGLTLAQRRGKAVFDRTITNRGEPIPPEKQCGTCHSGPYKTNLQKTPLRNTMWFDDEVKLESFNLFDPDEFGELGVYYYIETIGKPNELDVPHLTNIYDSAPYLHNGAANTLEEIWTRFNIVDDHGMTIDLTRRQFNDLIDYLRAL